MPITNGPAAGTVTLFMYVFCRYLWDRRGGDALNILAVGPMPDHAVMDEPVRSNRATATLSAVRHAPVHLRERVVIVLAYSAVIALASELNWIIWTPILGRPWTRGSPEHRAHGSPAATELLPDARRRQT